MRCAKGGDGMERYVIAVDQSTSASKVFLVDAQGEIVKRFSKEHRQFYPKPGYVEHDAQEIWQNVLEGIHAVASGLEKEQLCAIALSNQRETTVLWERETGQPVMHAIVWQDVRGEALCRQLEAHEAMVEHKTGLKLSAYYPAAKAASALADAPELRDRVRSGEICIGTIDSYLVYRLTGGKVFATDVSNASRTELCDIHSLAWDEALCGLFDIPMSCLAEIRHSDGDFGRMEGLDIPITGVMGDSHAALFGQGCLKAGMAKATFGTGSSVMLNVGERVAQSQNGLSASVGFGFAGKTCYVLEGNITCSGDTLRWLRDEARMIGAVDEVEAIAQSVENSGGVYLIPAFSGLGAPYFDGDARAALIGMSHSTTRAHIVRAALESLAFQDADVVDAMSRDTGIAISELRVDGGPTRNALLMQCLSDLTGARIQCARQSELSALGAAYMAGLKTGLYTAFDRIPAVGKAGQTYTTTIGAAERESRLAAWRDAVRRCRS